MNARGWKPERVAIVAPGGDRVVVDAVVSKAYPGFAVIAHGDGGFGVTHTGSGFAIARYFVSSAAAVALIQELAALPGWSRDVVALRADEDLSRAVWRIRADFYAREESGEFGPVDEELIAQFRRFEDRLDEEQPTKERRDALRARQSRRHH